MQTFLASAALLAVTASVTSANRLSDVCTIDSVKSALPTEVLDGVTVSPNSMTVNAVTNYSVTASDLYPAGSGLDFCNVTFAYTRDGESDATTNLWYWLPSPDQWQGRYVSVGGGGLAITSGEDSLGAGVVYGAVTGTTDGGFGSWTATLDEVLLLANGTMDYDMLFNFGYRSIHELSVLGKAFTENFYATEDFYSYYHGCSEGGREGWSQLQRFGSQFDGAAIGAPAFRQAFQQTIHLFSGLVEHLNGYAPPPCELEKINNDTIAFCDRLDGREDGVVSRTDLCKLHYNADTSIGEAYSCGASSGSSPPFGGGSPTPAINGTVSAKATKIANEIWKGLFDSKGRQAYVSFQPAASFEDASTTYDSATDSYQIAVNGIGAAWVDMFLKEIDSSDFSYDNVTYDDLRNYMLWGMQKFADTLQTTWPDLEDFRDAGGKVIHYHGESDNSIPTASSTIYHDSVRKIMYPEHDLLDGYDQLHEWYRLFLIPGAAHCSRNSEQPNGPFPGNILQSVIDWVEQGINPERLNATVESSAPVVEEDQKICSFPLRPIWKSGSSMDCVFDQKSYDTWVPKLNSIPLPVY